MRGRLLRVLEKYFPQIYIFASGASLVYFRARASEWEGGNGRTESHVFFGGRVVFFFMSLPLFPKKIATCQSPCDSITHFGPFSG